MSNSTVNYVGSNNICSWHTSCFFLYTIVQYWQASMIIPEKCIINVLVATIVPSSDKLQSVTYKELQVM